MSLLHKTLKTLKNTLVPGGLHLRKIPIGLNAGSVMYIDLHHQFRQYLSMYEFELNPHFKRLVRPGYSCFDVGGKGGYNALMMAKLSQGKIVSFECEDEAIDELKDVFSKNPYKIDIVKAFVGEKEDSEHKTLDWAAKEFFMPDFMKIDIEGSEVDALKGASEILKVRKPHMIIEVHGKDKEEGCLELLAQYGYQPLIVDQNTVLPEIRSFSHNRWLVCEGKD